MPRGNGMGPFGQGPMTGRGMGYCAGFAQPGFANAGGGYGHRIKTKKRPRRGPAGAPLGAV